MNRTITILLLSAIWFGCASLPRQWERAEQDYAVCLGALVEIRESGALNPTSAMMLENKMNSIEDLLIEMRLSAYANDKNAFKTGYKEFRKQLKELVRLAKPEPVSDISIRTILVDSPV